MTSGPSEELSTRAREAVSAGNYREARTLYAKAVEHSADSPDAHFGLATCCFMLGDLQAAKRHFKEVTRLDPMRATAYINLGALYNRLGQQDDAITALRRGLQLDPRRAEGYYNLGIAYRHKDLKDLAIQAYREATRLNPRMADAFLNLGNLLLESERIHEAIAAYEQALAVRPHFDKAEAGLRSAQQALAAHRPRPPEVPAETAAAREPGGPAELAEARPFANIVERADAIEQLLEACRSQEDLCKEILRVIELELGPALRDLSHSLVGTPATGELEIHVEAYEKSLKRLRSARQNMDQGVRRIREIGARFAAAAQADPVL